MITAYFQNIENTINSSSPVRSSSLYKDEREDEILFLRGGIRFVDGSFLHFREFVQIKRDLPVNRYTYVYHYQGADEKMIFRYDNAPHYPKLPTAPHHKHIGESDVIAVNPPNLEEVIQEIERLIA